MTDTPPNPSGTDRDDPADRFRLRSRALGDPTRYEIYRHIARAERPVTVAELTEAFALNHTTVRQHLGKLDDAGLLTRITDAPRGPGRPRVLYRLTDEAAAEWNDEGPYERLSLLLLEIATTGASPLDVGRAAGRRAPLDRSGDDPVVAMTAAMAAQGFAPRVTTHTTADGDRTELVLGNCPFAAAAEVGPQIVCALHRGMLEGLASQFEGLELTDLVADDPHRARCVVRVGRSD